MCHFVYARRMRLLQAARYRWGAVLHSSYLRELSFGCRLAVTAPVAQFPYSAFASQGEGKLLPFALCSSSEEGKPPDIAANDPAEPVTRRVFAANRRRFDLSQRPARPLGEPNRNPHRHQSRGGNAHGCVCSVSRVL